MNSLEQDDVAVRSTVSELEKKGYSVILEPDPSIIPFDLNQYRPNILATRGDENLIIEIKTKGSNRSIERYKEIAEIVGRHNNWRFMLSTIENPEQTDYAWLDEQVDLSTINRMLERLNNLLEGENYDLALPYLWTLYISAMRLIGQNDNIPADVTSDRSVLNYMYSLGEISGEEFEWALQVLQLRNEAVHRLQVSISRDELLGIYNHIKSQLIAWGLVAQQ